MLYNRSGARVANLRGYQLSWESLNFCRQCITGENVFYTYWEPHLMGMEGHYLRLG